MEADISMTKGNKGVANGKRETKRDGETGVFLCEPETFLPFKMRD